MVVMPELNPSRTQAVAEVIKLRAEVAALRADKARLDWIFRHAYLTGNGKRVTGIHIDLEQSGRLIDDREDLDAAIDAAMKERDK